MPHIANSIPIVSDPEQLKNVGEYLKQFLDPFGIDVSYYVDSLSRNATAASGATAAPAAASASSSTEEEAKKESTTTSTTTTPMETTTTTTTTTVHHNNDVLKPTTTTTVEETIVSSANDTTTPVKEDLIDLKQSSTTLSASAPLPSSEDITSPFEFAANALKQVVENPSMSSVTVIPTIKASDLQQKKEEEFQGFNLVDMEKEIRFINCIEQLKSMGYNDDAGWLSRLVIAKDGNINQVLDSLHPSKN
jgi:hypothetical protein